jgi:hypothetical protein
MKVSIFSFAVNDKFPFDIAFRQYKKFLKDPFEFIIFNDAMNTQMENNINVLANSISVKCVRVPQNIHRIQNPSEGYASTLNWAIHEYALNNGHEIVVLIHTDVFPICDVSIHDIIGNNIVASTSEFRIVDGKGITYLYPALTMVNMMLLSNVRELDFGLTNGLDTGGKTKDFILNHPQSVKFLNNHQASYMQAILKGQPLAEYFSADIDICRQHGLSAGWVADGLYHYMAGSQWNAGENPNFAAGHQKRMELFLRYFY